MKKLLAMALIAAMSISVLAGCGSTAETASTEEATPAEETTEAAEEATEESEEAETAEAADGQTYTIGICQLVQHPALDAATQGFKDALTEALGDAVTFDEQNASGESANCATIVNTFVSDQVDLILANATAPLQAAASATGDIPILGTSVTDYATALEIEDWTIE